MSDGKTPWTMTINTERLILRPQYKSDYESWYAGFANRLPKQHPYDEGKLDRLRSSLVFGIRRSPLGTS